MKSRKLNDGYILVLQKGEKLVASLLDFCEANGLGAGWISGLGAVQAAEIGFYDLKEQRYYFTKLEQLMEIASLSGNLSNDNGQLTAHLHTVLADDQLQTHGGHLKEATIGGTCEIRLTTFAGSFNRKLDDDTGLKLLDFDES